MKSIEVMFLPHPPIALPELQRGQGFKIEETLKGYEAIAGKVHHIRPETIIYITPHGNSFNNGVCLLDSEVVHGDLGQFGHEEIKKSKTIDRELTWQIQDKFDEAGILSVLMNEHVAKQYQVHDTIDHGVLVPMFFIDNVYDSYELVHITPSGQDLLTHYKMGVLIGEVLSENTKRVLVVCSGDLSHALKDDGPYNYDPFGPEFDAMVVEAVKMKDPLPLLELSSSKERHAAQCGLRSFLMGFGMMDGHDYASEVMSYEGPFGVGYMTGYLANDFLSKQPSLLKQLESKKEAAYFAKLEKEDDYVKLARRAIETYVRYHKKTKSDECPTFMSEEVYSELMATKAGAFVSIHKNGQLRGCIGTTESTADSLFDEIVYCGISACSTDPRFNPVSEDELTSLEIKVDRLYPPEEIFDLDELDVKKYGVIVEQDRKRGLLLPNLDGVDTIEQQVSIVKQKAGIYEDTDLKYYRFEVERHY